MIVHTAILAALIIYTVFAWNSSQKDAAEAKEAAEENFLSEDIDPFGEVKLAERGDDSTASMVKVGVPLLATIIYGGVFTVVYLLPIFVDKIGEEVMGSGAEVEDDPLHDARAAVAAGDYSEAIQVYRKAWLGNRESVFPMAEIAKIQRTKLDNPVVALSTLKEALDDHEWSEDDAGFLMFRMAEIYEEDLKDEEKLVAILDRVTEELNGTRHSANAAEKLRQLAKGKG